MLKTFPYGLRSCTRMNTWVFLAFWINQVINQLVVILDIGQL